MDVLNGLLDGSRARGAFLIRSVLDPPWAMRIEDEAPLTIVAVTRGLACVAHASGSTTTLAAGDIALVLGPGHYTVADDPGTRPTIVIHPGQRCTTLDGEPLAIAMGLGTRTWGNTPTGSTTMLTGTYEHHSTVSRRLLDTLPPVVVVRAGMWDSPLVPLLAAEIVKDDPGQEVVLDRLLDLLVVAVLRAWLARPGAEPPAWWRASSDLVVGPALRLLHEDPARSWTVAILARHVGVSRANLARRFTEVVGQPPIAYLASWRLALAADLLAQRDTTIGSVARRVGYGSPYALSAAFKRVHGVSPRAHRRAGRPDLDERGTNGPVASAPNRSGSSGDTKRDD